MFSQVITINTEEYISVQLRNSVWPNITYSLNDGFLTNISVLESVSLDIENKKINPLIISNNDSSDIQLLKNKGIYLIDRWVLMNLNLKDFIYNKRAIIGNEFEYGKITSDIELPDWIEILSNNLFDGKELNIDIFSFLMRSSSDLFYLKHNNKIIGTILVYYDENSIAGVYMVSIDKSERKQGLGGQLMNYALKEVKKKGIKKVTLQSTKLGVNLYNSLGFKKKNDINLFYKIK
jgi:GNAT superfamily N-acetyltransferase